MKNNKIILKSISKSDYGFLYDLLEERNSQVNISHKTMPTYDEHLKFIKSKPYSKWYIIKYNDQKVGSIYLTKINEIGIHIVKEIRRKNVATSALKILMKKNLRIRFLANINPKNKKSIEFFIKQNFKLIQYTYELIPSNSNK